MNDRLIKARVLLDCVSILNLAEVCTFAQMSAGVGENHRVIRYGVSEIVKDAMLLQETRHKPKICLTVLCAVFERNGMMIRSPGA
jgi:hypothetical protein